MGWLRRSIQKAMWKALSCMLVTFAVISMLFFQPTSSAYNSKRGWIEFVKPSGNFYYVVTNERCTPDEPYGHLQQEALGGSAISNVLPHGTQMYRIKGVDPTEAFAVALDYGSGGYVKAVYAGRDEPH